MDDLDQDGHLLSFLATHLRGNAPEALTRRVVERANWLQCVLGDVTVVISDARPIDLPELRRAGFDVVLVSVPEHLRLARLKSRRIVSENPDLGKVELGREAPEVNFEVVNDQSLEQLASQASDLLENANKSPGVPPWFDDSTVIRDLGERLRNVATDAITKVYRPSRHQLGCAMLGDDGEISVGIHVEALVGRASSCAENGALAQTLARSAVPIAMISVRHPRPDEDRGIEPMPPCGICRELITGYAPNALVWLDSGPHRMSDLLPERYVGTKWRNERG